MADADDQLTRKYNMTYLEIIMRYRDYIEENENLSVAELPKLVIPDNEDVVAVANKIRGAFLTYNYDDNFADAARAAYEYISKEIMQISLPLQFWLSPDQVIKIGAGDTFDKAVLLCSLLIALGGISAKIMVVIDGTERRLIVATEYKERVMAIDLDKGFSEYQSKDSLIESVGIGKNEDTTAYEFNDKMYNDLA